MGETKGFLFFIGNFFGKKNLFTSLLIERQEKSQNLGSIPIALQKLCRKNQAPGTKYPPPGANRVKGGLFCASPGLKTSSLQCQIGVSFDYFLEENRGATQTKQPLSFVRLIM